MPNFIYCPFDNETTEFEGTFDKDPSKMMGTCQKCLKPWSELFLMIPPRQKTKSELFLETHNARKQAVLSRIDIEGKSTPQKSPLLKSLEEIKERAK